MKAAAHFLASLPFRLMPGCFVRRVLQAAFEAVGAREPRAAMRALLEIETDLTGRINQVALGYGGGIHVKHRLMKYHDFFVERIQPGERVLDIGCGYGAVAYSIASRTGAQVTGIDLDAANIAQASERFRNPHLTFVQGDALTDLPDERFDTIVFSNVLEHIERRVEFLSSAQRRLEPRRWLIRVPAIDRDWRVPLREELGLYSFSDPTHFIEYTRQSFEAELQAAGLRITHIQFNWGEIWAEAEVAGDA